MVYNYRRNLNMSKSKKLEEIYVDLDVLLDTRLGTLARMDSSLAEKVASDPNYRSRRTDAFEILDEQQLLQFRELYKNRNADTIKRSMVTNGIQLLKETVKLLAEQAVVRPYHDGSKVVVNMWPYTETLSEEEYIEIGKAITVWMGGSTPVELFTTAPENLHPELCKNTYAMMIKYDYEDWMNLQTDAFRKSRLPDMTLLAPAVFLKNYTDEEIKKVTKESMHPIQELEMLASPLISLTLIDVAYFSLLKPN